MTTTNLLHTYVGIDYSMSSPAIAIYSGSKKNFDWKKVTFYYNIKDQPSFQKKWKRSGRDSEVWCHGESYTNDYRSNIERFKNLGNWALDCIGRHQTDVDKCTIYIEDYALGAKGRTFEIAENTGILKYMLEYVKYRYSVVSPTAVKKFATQKGNSDKSKMYDAWMKDTKSSYDLWKEFTPGRKNLSSPVTDIVDSYFLVKMAVYEVLTTEEK